VLNNPTIRIDPTGWFSFKRAFKKVGSVAKAVVTAGPVTTALAAAINPVSLGAVGVVTQARVVSTIATFNPTASSVGLTLGFAGWLADPKLSNIRIGWGAIEFTNNEGVAWLPGNRDAITLGNVILYKHGPDTRLHEYNHVLQSTLLGPYYIPAHLAFGFASIGVTAATGGNVKEKGWWQYNPLERLTTPGPQALTITK
jgi:hypothetical protein